MSITNEQKREAEKIKIKSEEDSKKAKDYVHNILKDVPIQTETKTNEETSKEAKKTAETEIRKKEIKKTLYSLGDSLKKGIPEQKWTIQNLVCERGITILAGAPGCMKSFLAQQMSLSVASNKTFLDQFQTIKGNVLYFDEENGIQAILRRFNQLIDEETDEELNDIKTLVYSGLKLDNETDIYALEKIIFEYEPKLVILDSMVRLMEGEEDKAKDVKKVFEGLKGLIENYNIGIVLLHHLRKDSGKPNLNSLRGSSDFGAFADVVLIVEKSGHYLTLRIEKNRHIDTSEIKPFKINILGSEDKIRFSWNGLSEQKNSLELCKEDIVNWVKNNNIEEIITDNLINVMKKKGHSQTNIYNARKEFIDSKFFLKIGRGKFKVNFNEEIKEEYI